MPTSWDCSSMLSRSGTSADTWHTATWEILTPSICSSSGWEWTACSANSPTRPLRHADHDNRSAPVSVEDGPQVGRHRHGTHGTDIGATCVADRHPQAREHCCCHDACQLTCELAPVASLPGDAQHADMTSHVQASAALAEDVRALQMMKRGVEVTGIAGGPGQRPLLLECFAYRSVHDLTTCTPQGVTDRSGLRNCPIA